MSSGPKVGTSYVPSLPEQRDLGVDAGVLHDEVVELREDEWPQDARRVGLAERLRACRVMVLIRARRSCRAGSPAEAFQQLVDALGDVRRRGLAPRADPRLGRRLVVDIGRHRVADDVRTRALRPLRRALDPPLEVLRQMDRRTRV